MFPHAFTVYNKYKDGKTEKWQRTVVKGVLWNAIKGITQRKTGAASADSVRLIIPFGAVASRKYCPPKQWAALPDKSRYWTLQSGDTILRGEIRQEVQSSSAELQALDGHAIITAVDTNDYSSMAHWEVSGK